MAGTEMMHETIWFDQPKFEEAEAAYQHHLAGTSCGTVSSHPASSLIDQIAKARNSIKKSLNETPGSVMQGSDKTVAALQKENNELRQMVTELTKRMNELEVRMNKMEGKPAAKEESAKPKEESAKPKEDDDDFDLFGSDSEDEEQDEDRQKLLDKYHEKKAKKGAVIAKSNILLDIKPWADDTDLEEMEKLVRGVQTDGLVWGSSKLVPVAFGIKKLQIACVVEDDKVGTDFLEEKITEFEDHVQSVDVAAFNKV